jgi:hypothetical protein
MSGEYELPTAAVLRSSQATPARRPGQLLHRCQTSRAPLIETDLLFRQPEPPLYGLLANGTRKTNLALVRELLHVVPAHAAQLSNDAQTGDVPIAAQPAFVCRHCGHAMIILQSFVRGESIRAPPGPGCTP